MQDQDQQLGGGVPVEGRPALRPTNARAVVAAVAVVTLYAAWRRAADLDPASLWLDDAWVAVLARAPSLGDLLANCSSTPPLFALLVAACVRLVPDPEVGAQLVAFVAGVALVPLTAFAAGRLSGRAVVAIAAAVLLAADPLAVTYSARVKQYSTDGVVAVLHLLALQRVRASPSSRAAWTWAVLGVAGVLLSSVSLFVLVSFVGAWAVCTWRDDPPRRPHVAAVVGAVAVASALLAFVVLGPASNAALHVWWRDHFLPTTSAGAFLAALWRAVGSWVAEPLHGAVDGPAAWVGLTLALLGARALHRAGRGAVALGLGLLVALLVAASAADRFPLGTGRVELFLTPLVVVTLACALPTLDLVRAPVWRRAWPPAAVALLAAHVHGPRVAQYPRQESAPLVAALAPALAPDDALVVNTHGLFALCYYGPWTVRLTPNARVGTGFIPEPVGTDLRVVESDPDVFDPAFLARALADRPGRALVFLCHDYGLSREVPGAAAQLGYAVVARDERPGCVVMVLAPAR